MVSAAHRLCACLLAALGAVHVGVTPLVYQRLSPGSMWFVGAGLAMMFAGFLNLVLNFEPAPRRASRVLCHAANLLMLGLAALAVTVVREPQAYLAILLIAVVTVTAYGLKRGTMKR